MKLNSFWVVCNPSPLSEIGDICWESNVADYSMFVLGTQNMGKSIRQEGVAFYTKKSEAVADAQDRLAKIKNPTP